MNVEQIEALRSFLYPFGFLSSIAFGLRFLVQWWASERKKRSVVPKIFWHLSLTGNVLLMLHSLIQIHFPMYILQSQHILLSWRNLNFMGKRPVRLRTIISLLLFIALATTSLFIIYQMAIGTGDVLWIRPLGAKRSAPTWLHIVGCIGIGAFSFRFWLQWWEAEKNTKSLLSEKFWWISLFGAFVTAFYFYKTRDFVNIVGPLFALIPYIRNLMLLKTQAAPCSSLEGERGKQDTSVATKGRLLNLAKEQYEGDYFPQSASRENRTQLRVKTQAAPCDIAIISGETSGDLLGKQIASELLASKPDLSLCGVAGPAMREVGVTPWMRTESFQVMGIVDVIKKLPFLSYSIYRLVRTIMKNNPKAVILIDQPSFSLAIAKRLKKKGFSGKIIQAVAPTVWAYKPERVDSFATYFDLILPLYRFEEELFSKKLPTVWMGHPIVHELKKVGDAKEKNTLSLFPGSRPAEIRRNLPLQLKAAAAIVKDHPDLRVAISVSKTLSRNYIETLAKKELVQEAELVDFSNRYELMSRSKAAIAKLGTITLELALFDVPCVCCYKIGRFTEWWARRFLRLTPRDFALPNILYGKTVMPECVIPPVVAQDLHREITPYLIGEKSFPENLRESLIKQIDPQHKSEGFIAQAILESL